MAGAAPQRAILPELKTEGQLHYLDFEPEEADLLAEIRSGLSQHPKRLPCKLFYDQTGSELFDRITELPEYYVTRTETKILEDNIEEIRSTLGENCVLVEYGSGSSIKTRILLDNMPSIAGYVPMDISRDYLLSCAEMLQADYPKLKIVPIVADYLQKYSLPEPPPGAGRTSAFFPGSTLGNFIPQVAEQFLVRVRELVGDDGGLLIGVDLRKDPAIIERAYNDAAGVTAQFNKNPLRVANERVGTDFDADAFKHRAVWDDREGRIEMRLISKRTQVVHVEGQAYSIREGEYIRTEFSHKFTLEQVKQLAESTGFTVEKVWCDAQRLFSVQYFRSA